MNTFFSLISYGYELFVAFGLYVLILVGFFLLFKKPVYAYYLTVFTIPFKSLYIWMGTNIEVWKLMSAMSLVVYGPKILMLNSHKIRKNPNIVWLLFFITYTLFITIVFPFTIPDTDKHIMAGGFFKNGGRIIFQIVFFLITYNLILWPSYIFNNVNQVFSTFRVIVISVISLAVLGLVQLVSLTATGYDPFPIHRIHGFDNTGGMIVMQGFEGVQRLNSLAGEPKHFAIAIIIGFLILMIHRLNNIRIIRHELPVIGIFLVCLLATYSTTGFIWFGFTIFFILSLYRQKFSRMAFVLIALSSVSLFIINSGTGGSEANSAYIDQAINKTGLEPQDEAVLGYFKNNPFEAITGLGLGNIHHYAVDYLPPNFPIFRDTPFKGNTGFFLLLGDVGMIGILLFTVFIAKLILRKTVKSTEEKRQKVLEHILLISFILFSMRYFELFYVISGISLYYNAPSNKQQIQKDEL